VTLATPTLLASVEAVRVPLGIDLAAVFVSAVFGALIALRRGSDLTGVVGLALLGGLGGGVVRDVLLNQVPVALTDPAYVPTALVAAAIVSVAGGAVQRSVPLLSLADAFSLGLYGVVGASKATQSGLGSGSAILVGVIAAVAGGVFCDIATGRPVGIFQPGPLHATAALVGVALFVALDGTALPGAVTLALGIGGTAVARIIGLRGLHGPRPLPAQE
jgi:uncharacterized membrane protein YeiH